jgi:hypothetical protein
MNLPIPMNCSSASHPPENFLILKTCLTLPHRKGRVYRNMAYAASVFKPVSARCLLIELVCQPVRFTSPRRGEVDLPTGRRKAPPDDKLRKSGEGAMEIRETATPHPNPLPMGEGADFRRLC